MSGANSASVGPGHPINGRCGLLISVGQSSGRICGAEMRVVAGFEMCPHCDAPERDKPAWAKP